MNKESNPISISVIIPTFGTPGFLEDAIKSVVHQTYSSWELILVDDNDPESKARELTVQLVAKFQSQGIPIIYVQHEFNKNGAAARNTGFSESKGKYIAFLDSDDLYHINRLEKCINLMERTENPYMGVYTGCEFRRGGAKYFTFKDVKKGNFLAETLAGKFMFCTGSNLFVTREVYVELNGFDENFLRHQDYEFLVRFFTKYKLQAIQEVLVVKNNENFNLPNVAKMIQIKHQYLKKFKDIIAQLELSKQKYIYKSHWVSIAEQALKIGDLETGKKYYQLAVNEQQLTTIEKLRRLALLLRNKLKI